MLIISECVVQMVGCIFAEGFFQAKFIDMIYEFVMLYS